MVSIHVGPCHVAPGLNDADILLPSVVVEGLREDQGNREQFEGEEVEALRNREKILHVRASDARNRGACTSPVYARKSPRERMVCRVSPPLQWPGVANRLE